METEKNMSELGKEDTTDRNAVKSRFKDIRDFQEKPKRSLLGHYWANIKAQRLNQRGSK